MSSSSPTKSCSTTEGLNQSTNVVLKLSIDEGDKAQLRRIPLARLWEDGKASYKRLVDFVLEYSSIENLNDDEKEMKVEISYVDEDGDTIHISTDEELSDAFEQFVDTKPPVLRAKGQLVRKTKKLQQTKAPQQTTTKTRAAPAPQRDPRRSNSSKSSSAKMPQVNVLFEAVRPIVHAIQEKIAEEELNTKEKLKDIMQNYDKESSAPPVNTESFKAVAAVAKERLMDVMENAQDIVLETENAKSAHPQPQNESEEPFLHGRHTCDKCLCSPIVGTRYHATNTHDFDLCANCFRAYEGDDIHFQPEVCERDRPMQKRWRRRQACRLRQARFSGGEYPGNCRRSNRRRHRLFKSSNENTEKLYEFGDSLKEAIRRSLEDLKVENKVSVNKKDEKQQPSATEDSEVDDKEKVTRENANEDKEGKDMKQRAENVTEPKLDGKETKTDKIPEKNEESNDTLLNDGNDLEDIFDTFEEVNKEFNSLVVEDDDEEQEIEFVSDSPVPDLEIISKEPEKEVIIMNDTVADIKEQEVDIKEPVIVDAALVEIIDATVVPHEEENIFTEDAQIQQEVAPIESQQQSEAEVDDWDVVDEADDINEQISGDEALARAASLIGSALFQSDLSDSLLGRQTTNSTQRK